MVLLSSNEFTTWARTGLYVIAPTTTRNRGMRSQVPVRPPEGGLRAPSLIMCEQLRALDEDNLLELWGELSTDTMALVDERLRMILDLY